MLLNKPGNFGDDDDDNLNPGPEAEEDKDLAPRTWPRKRKRKRKKMMIWMILPATTYKIKIRIYKDTSNPQISRIATNLQYSDIR